MCPPEKTVSQPLHSATHQAALDLLARREHSRRELARKLRRRGHSHEDVEAVLERLEAVGLVSDARYARLFVADKLSVRPQGTRRLIVRLRAKGIPADLAREAVGEVYEERGVSDRELARDLVRRRARTLAGLDPQVVTRRLAGFLARRGFGADVVAGAMRDVLGPGLTLAGDGEEEAASL